MEETDAEIADGAKLIETIQAGGVLTGLFILFVTWLVVRLITAALDRSGNRFVHRRLFFNQIATWLITFALLLFAPDRLGATDFGKIQFVIAFIGGVFYLTGVQIAVQAEQLRTTLEVQGNRVVAWISIESACSLLN